MLNVFKLLHLLLVGDATSLSVIDPNSEVDDDVTTAQNLESTHELTACNITSTTDISAMFVSPFHFTISLILYGV